MYNKLKHIVLTLISIFILGISTPTKAQELRCGTMERFDYENKENNALLLERNSISKTVREWKKKTYSHNESSSDEYNFDIPESI